MSDAQGMERPIPKRSRIGATIKAITRARITAGLITVLPIYVSIVVIQFVFRLMRDASQWVVYGVLRHDWTPWGINWKGLKPEEVAAMIGTQPQPVTIDPSAAMGAVSPTLQWGIAIVSVLLTGFILYAIGVFTANMVGRRLLSLFEFIVDRVPLVKTVYHASKQILESFAGSDKPEFQRVALVPFPSRDARSIGFITAVSSDPATGEELVSVFIATTPNPTTGYVIMLKRSDVIELDWGMEQAVKVVMSGGILLPAQMPFSAPVPHAPAVR